MTAIVALSRHICCASYLPKLLKKLSLKPDLKLSEVEGFVNYDKYNDLEKRALIGRLETS